MKYVVEIEETYVKHVVVEAENSNEALAIANDAYNNKEVIFDYRDHMDTEFKCLRKADEDDVNDYETIQN